MQTVAVQDFDEWRNQARFYLERDIPPSSLIWEDAQTQNSLFDQGAPIPDQPSRTLSVPKYFMDFALRIAAHRHPEKWALLYQALWRITHGETFLFKLSTDPLMHRLDRMDKEVRRDMHKTKAFVRFRKIENDGDEHYVAWHRPDHKILHLVAPFFKTRFAVMKWTIMTPLETMIWDGTTLQFTKGLPKSEAPQDDMLEDLWRDYYRATFNPARIKIKTMKREMPTRHWATLPETSIITDMLAEAPLRVEKMIAAQEGSNISAADFIPAMRDYMSLKNAAKICEGCPLHRCATQTVFGEGPVDAPIMLIGEQPGNDEDLSGRAFVGPAGQVLDRALKEAGLERSSLYITNAVKHFKFRLEREKRMHRSPDAREIIACKPWLKTEIDLVKPKLILCMGATAGKALIGHGFTLKKEHGKWYEGPHEARITTTYHPSAVLRNQKYDPDDVIFQTIVRDLKLIKATLNGSQLPQERDR